MRREKQAMTLIEMVVTVSIVALLTLFLVPTVQKSAERRENGRCASRMRIAVQAFDLYRSEMGAYPADSTPGQIPPEMAAYFEDLGMTRWWSRKTKVGGHWDWDNGYHFAYSVSIASPRVPVAQLKELDALLDDGNLETGHVRKVGVQFHYILEE